MKRRLPAKIQEIYFKYYIFARFSVFSAVAQWSERLLGMEVVRVQASTKPNFFLVVFVCLFFAFFISWYVFP